MSSPFRGARLKIKRANHHINDLHLRWREFTETGPYSVLVEVDPKTGDSVLMIRTDQPAPEPILLIVGDAIHNLRSALDFAISDIEFLTTGVRDPHTSFPIRDTKDQLVAAVCGGLKKKIPKAVTDHIVNVVQPYRGGNGSSIWSLHALDIEDKHRLLITKKEWSWIRNIHCKDGRGECFTIPEWATIDPHTFTHICTGHQNVQVVDEGKATFSMVFGDDMPFYGKHILPTLRNLSHFVSHTLDSIEHI